MSGCFYLHLVEGLCHCNSITNFFQSIVWGIQIKCLQLTQENYSIIYL